MCDQDHFEEDVKKYSRRDIGTLAAAGVGAAMMLPRSADAAEVSERDVSIKTPDGQCDAYFVAPNNGPHAAVLVWPDIFGLRPAFRQMGKRLAESGYAVLVVNPFYRTQPAPHRREWQQYTDFGSDTFGPIIKRGNTHGRCEDIHCLAGRTATSRQEQKDWNDRILYGWPDGDAYGGSSP